MSPGPKNEDKRRRAPRQVEVQSRRKGATTRILAFSDWRVQSIGDLLSFVKDLKTPLDLILYGGDDIRRFEKKGTNYFTELSKHTKQRKVLVVVGNDDSHDVKTVLRAKNVHDLHERPFVYHNLAFLGLEASTKGPGSILHTEKEVKRHLREQLSQVRGKELVILSHTPPYGVLDIGIRFADTRNGIHHIGTTSLRDFVQRNGVELVVCGHCHSQGGSIKQMGRSTVVNVSSHDSPGSKGNIALIEIDSQGKVIVDWHHISKKPDSPACLHGIGSVREERLRILGITTIADLAEAKDLSKIAGKSGLSEALLRRFQLKAKSALENKVYQIAPLNLPEGNLIFFDIETDIMCERVWLIGLLRRGKFTRFYADNWQEERRVLTDFLRFIEENPDSVLVSFSGRNFDRNVIQSALRRLAIDSDVFYSTPHIDMCQLLRRSFVFPNQSYALKDLGTYLEYPFRHPDLSGLIVALEYQEHITKEKPLDSKLLEYNEDDVRAIHFILEKITSGKVKAEKKLITVIPTIRAEREISEESRKEIEFLRSLRLKGYTLERLSNKLDRSLYYIFSKLKSGHRNRKARESSKERFSKKELISVAREYYERFGSMSIRKDKRCSSYNVDIRFYAKNLEDLNPLRGAMASLGFVEGTPYHYADKERCYVPYYGREQAITFMEMVEPRTKNDISKLTKRVGDYRAKSILEERRGAPRKDERRLSLQDFV